MSVLSFQLVQVFQCFMSVMQTAHDSDLAHTQLSFLDCAGSMHVDIFMWSKSSLNYMPKDFLEEELDAVLLLVKYITIIYMHFSKRIKYVLV